jgi:secreted trypsin-like serine protease
MVEDEESRIVGGVEATPHEFPHQAAVFFSGSFCGGSLICESFFNYNKKYSAAAKFA